MKIEKLNNIVTGFLTNIGGTLAMFGVTIYLTRTVDQEVYGEFRLAFSFISLMVVLLLLGRDNSLLYYSQEVKELDTKDDIIAEESFYTLIVLLLGTCILFLSKGFIIRNFFNNNISEDNYVLSLLMLPLWGLFNMGTAGLKVKNYINYSFTLTNLIQRFIRVPFFILFVYFSKTFFSLTMSMVLSQVVLLLVVIRKIPAILRFRSVKISGFFKRFKYGVQLGLSAIIFVVLGKIDIMMLGYLSVVDNVAIYDVCVLLSFVVIFPYLALVKSSEPKMKSIVQDKSMLKKYNSDLSLSISIASIIVLIYFLEPELILSIFGSGYTKGSETLVILAFGYLIINFLGSPIEFLNMTGNVKESLIIMIFCLIINVVFNFLLIPKLGLIGAAIGTLSSMIITKLIGLLYLRKKIGLLLINKDNLKRLIPLVLVSIAYLLFNDHNKNIFISIFLVVVLLLLIMFLEIDRIKLKK